VLTEPRAQHLDIMLDDGEPEAIPRKRGSLEFDNWVHRLNACASIVGSIPEPVSSTLISSVARPSSAVTRLARIATEPWDVNLIAVTARLIRIDLSGRRINRTFPICRIDVSVERKMLSGVGGFQSGRALGK
jgi:hypothetical protein